MHQFILGALTMASCVIGLFFLRFWRQSGDRLLLVFATAFFVLAVDWGLRGAWEPTLGTRHYFFLVRLLAFVLLVIGIIDK
ncbi:MAG TPA: DUF5985 family protein, partial [Polyangia bacterium]|nr:DUF5985 family protein [Polyangia bacterium]